MTRVLVTGAAGFIGSNLCRTLLQRGKKVVGIDSFVPNYPREIKEHNLRDLAERPDFSFVEGDLLGPGLQNFIRGGQFEIVFHEAATAGVRTSWAQEGFERDYVPNNVIVTKRLLDACIDPETNRAWQFLKRFVYASSSSVYGDARGRGKLKETMMCRPLSPYGVTKLTGENLTYLYSREMGLPGVSLRYFSVYGPGHRPDMAAHIFTKALFEGRPIVAHQGDHARDFTFVGDVVQANLLASNPRLPTGSVYNVGGGSVVTLGEMIRTLEQLTGRKADIQWVPNPPGNVTETNASLFNSRRELGYRPQVGIVQGLAAEVDHIKVLYGFK